MNRKELQNKFGISICEYCRKHIISEYNFCKGWVCEKSYCKEAQDGYAAVNKIELDDLNIKKVEPIKGLSESAYNDLVSHCKRKIEQCKYSPSLLLIYNEHRIFLELLERVGRDFIDKEE